MNLKEEIDVLIQMIKRPTSSKHNLNHSMYMDEVTKYRGILMKQAMKIKRKADKELRKEK